MSELWPDTFVEEGSLTRNISALRKALAENPREHRYIVTVPGQGYSFVAKVGWLSGETRNLTITPRIRTSITVIEESDDARQSKTDQIFGFEWSPDGKQLVFVRGIWERNLVLIKDFK